MAWEDKWDKYIGEGIGKNEDGSFVSGESVWRPLPKFLYHATSPAAAERIKKAGGLGYTYRAHDPHLDKREWSREGTGVYFAFAPEVGVEFMGRGPESAMKDKWQESVIFQVSKFDLDPSKFYVDEDVGFYADSDDPWEFKEWLENGAVYYEGTVPIEKCIIKSITEFENRRW